MRDYFEEMNIDYNELKRYEDIETYYDEVQDYTKLIKELQCDRVEALKQIVNKNKEIERLNNIINELEKCWKDQQEKYRYYKDNRYRTFLSKNLDKLQELKGDSSNE